METKLSVTFILKGRLPLTKEAADSLEKQQQGLGYHKEVYKGFDKNGKPTNKIVGFCTETQIRALYNE